MNKEEIKRLPFVVKAYSIIYPTESQCNICGLPWSVGGAKNVNIGQDWGIFYVCPHCWETRTKEEILRASVRGYISQYECASRNESDREKFLKNHQLDEILYKIEQEYNKTHLEYSIKVKTLRIPRRIKKALKKGLPYKIGFRAKKHPTGTVLTPKIKIQK